ncbi:MAG: hypothetical protein O3A97_08685 [Proteobacteria bacterium]|nr:hypothetical protein [Pseudomonadota bacterium]
MMTHDRVFVRPLLRRIVNRQGAFVEIMARRAAYHPELAAHLATALDDLETACPDPTADSEPRPQLPK